MDLSQTIDGLRAEALRLIEEGARDGKASAIAELSARLQRIERVRERHDALVRDVEALAASRDGEVSAGEDRETAPTADGNGRAAAPQPQRGESPRRHAEQRRREFIDRLATKGVEFGQVRGPIYQTPSGSRVGLPFATERQPNRWFLGLPDGEFAQAVLLCELNDGGDVAAFSLDEGFCARHRESLSRDARGQLKFNVSRRAHDQFVLNVPRHEPVDLGPMRDRFEHLR